MKKLLILLFTFFILVNKANSANVIFADATVYLNESGIAEIDNSIVEIINDDNLIQSLSFDKNIFSTKDIGENWVTLTVIDVNKKIDYYTSIITVLDIMPPVVYCKNATVYLNELGEVEIDNSLINNGSSDNSSIYSISLDKNTFSTEEIGENWVTLTVIDEYGNVDYCTSIVTVLDALEPIITSVEVESDIIYVPTAFTPNNDGINDVFMPILNDQSTIKFEFIVYNLKNEIVFRSNSKSDVWDGKFSGIDVPTGDYVWTLTSSSKITNNIQSQKGHVKLIR